MLGRGQRFELSASQTVTMARIGGWRSLVQLALPAVVVVVDPVLLVAGYRLGRHIRPAHIVRQRDLLDCLDGVELAVARVAGVPCPPATCHHVVSDLDLVRNRTRHEQVVEGLGGLPCCRKRSGRCGRERKTDEPADDMFDDRADGLADTERDPVEGGVTNLPRPGQRRTRDLALHQVEERLHRLTDEEHPRAFTFAVQDRDADR